MLILVFLVLLLCIVCVTWWFSVGGCQLIVYFECDFVYWSLLVVLLDCGLLLLLLRVRVCFV